MTEVTIKLPYLTHALLSGRAGVSGRTIEQEAVCALLEVENEALRNALRNPSQDLLNLLTVLLDMDDEFLPLSTLARKSALHSEHSVRSILAWLNRRLEEGQYLYWSSFLEEGEGGYRLPAHLRPAVSEALEG